MRYTVSIETKADGGIMYHNITVEAENRTEAMTKSISILESVAGDFSSIHISAIPSVKEKRKRGE